jgi:3',5'-cyclic-AMP phosphodiesterase
MKLIHLTDTHLVSAGQKLYGLDPRKRLNAAVADINAHHSDADLVVVTGDLTHWGEADAYQQFTEAMQPLEIPYKALVGNHDRRQACLNHVPSAPRDPNGFVQGVQDTELGRLIFLDTLNEASHAGQLCETRLCWLEATLHDTPAKLPIFLFMHHPPCDVGIVDMDRIGLIERERFAAVVKPYSSRIWHLFFGHVHRPISGSWHGIPFSTLRGTNHQVWFDLGLDCEHLGSHEPPAYGVVLISADAVVVHTHDFMDQSLRFPYTITGRDERSYALGPMPAPR